ncbi:glycerol kinase-like [Condylostylus longicornis]|uniref:glycerol kinase-like n=1 Tax=Condylostylus longicornis TaxID=2530218 RepID=UPI00244E59F6|nr:glycerol kinase-like [Condylostylus longicornis]
MTNKPKVVGAIDQGTVNTKFSYFDERMRLLASHSVDHAQIYPKLGWLEHNPMELYVNTLKAMSVATHELKLKYPGGFEVAAVGVVNQRETLVVWDRSTGLPQCNAIVWLDMRTNSLVHHLAEKYGGVEAFREKTGLPLASYFTGVKLLWLMENHPDIAEQLRNKEALIGTVDSWLVWKLTGGANGGVHITDITNASRTMLMDINTMTWSTEMLRFGTGATVMMVTGKGSPVTPRRGSVAIAGAALTWLKDNLGALETPEETEVGTIQILRKTPNRSCDIPFCFRPLLNEVQDTGDVYFVPAFAGLFAPRWRADARGCIVGLTQHSTKAHIVRALIESVGFQLAEILEALRKDAVSFQDEPVTIRVDGGLCKIVPSSGQVIADITGRTIAMRKNVEVTSLGAALLAAGGIGLISKDELKELVKGMETLEWVPKLSSDERTAKTKRWEMAVERSLDGRRLRRKWRVSIHMVIDISQSILPIDLPLERARLDTVETMSAPSTPDTKSRPSIDNVLRGFRPQLEDKEHQSCNADCKCE